MSLIKAAMQEQPIERRRSSDAVRRFEPLRTESGTRVWRPVLTEQEQKEREQYIKDNNLPF